MTTEYKRPMPQADEPSREFFEGARRHELMLMRCKACGTWRLPSHPRCHSCWSTDTEWAKASGRGTLYSFGVMHQKYPGFEDEVPYNYAQVQLEEGPRIVTDIVGVPNDELRVDMPVVAYFDDVSDDCTVVRFTPA
jgi:uncharacterized OB-fold protein